MPAPQIIVVRPVGLTALTGILLGVGDRVDHLQLVVGLVHDRLHVVAAQARRPGAVVGGELPVHLGGHALGEQSGRLHAADMGGDMARHRVDRALTAGAPEQAGDAESGAGRDTIGGTGGFRRGIGEQHRFRVEDGGQLVVGPQRIDFGEVDQSAPCSRHGKSSSTSSQ